MKKTLSFAVAVLVAIAVLMTGIVLVAFAADPEITMKSGETSNGQTEIVISVSEGTDLATFQAALKYDTEKVKLVSVEYLSGDKNVSNTKTEGLVLVNDVWTENIGEDTDFIRVVFSTLAEGETATFTLDDIKATDSNDNAIDFGGPVKYKLKIETTTVPEETEDQTTTTAPAADDATTTTAAAQEDTTTTAAPAADSNGAANGGAANGGTNGASPTTGRIIASAAGICGTAAVAAAVVVVLKKKGKNEE